MEPRNLRRVVEMWRGGVNRGEEVETRVSASVVLTILKFVNDEIKKDFRSKLEGSRNWREIWEVAKSFHVLVITGSS